MIALFALFVRVSVCVYNLADFIFPPVKQLESKPFTSFCSLGDETLTHIVKTVAGTESLTLLRHLRGLQRSAFVQTPPCPFNTCEVEIADPSVLAGQYALEIAGSSCVVRCSDVRSCLPAVKTFVGLVQPAVENFLFPLTDLKISDHASVAVRGLMLDTGTLPYSPIRPEILSSFARLVERI